MGRKKLLYKNKTSDIFKISRSNIQSYLECPKCFYLESVHGIKKPAGFPLPINMAVDSILKNEFDHYRAQGREHPEVKQILNLNLKPFNEDQFFDWRKNACVYHKETNFNIFGKLDDVWINEDKQKLYLADYKSGAVSTTKKFELHESFRNQMDIYLWIAKQLDPRFQEISFFYYKKLKKGDFMNESNFVTEIVEYPADDRWVEEIIVHLKRDLDNTQPPNSHSECKHCHYSSKRLELING